MEKENKATHITRGSVLDDLGFSPEKAAVLKMKAKMHAALLRTARKYSQKELQRILKEPQPRVSEFLNGKIVSMSLEKLTVYALRLGVRPAFTVGLAKKTSKRAASRRARGASSALSVPASISADNLSTR